LRRGPLKHAKDVKVHTTYFLPVEASKGPVFLEFIAVLEFTSSRSPQLFSVYCSATNNPLDADSAASIVPITCFN
jgi:hypothetical protein